jgi:hypothetical protein
MVMTKNFQPAQVFAICDREIAKSGDSAHKAKVRFMRDYLTDPHFRGAVEAFVAQRAVDGARRLNDSQAI